MVELSKRLPPVEDRQLTVLFYNMSVHQAGELKHVDFLFTVENGFQSGIGFDELFLLKIVLLNIFPEFFRELRPGNGIFTDNLGKRRIWLYWLHECAFFF